ncbi:MAG TPA: hypothetical protein VFK80_09765 [Limnochordia bacterium]|nr:hypothetical protein [Limnochordia bacterium]
MSPVSASTQLTNALSSTQTAVRDRNWTTAKVRAAAAATVFGGLKRLSNTTTGTRTPSRTKPWTDQEIKQFDTDMAGLRKAITDKDQKAALDRLGALMKAAAAHNATR